MLMACNIPFAIVRLRMMAASFFQTKGFPNSLPSKRLHFYVLMSFSDAKAAKYGYFLHVPNIYYLFAFHSSELGTKIYQDTVEVKAQIQPFTVPLLISLVIFSLVIIVAAIGQAFTSNSMEEHQFHPKHIHRQQIPFLLLPACGITPF